ncbi:hypothetical protein HDU67_000175 [Dinochytrium kinnereticum]|nr:hypothetical protein HDU67_000175 [Dinochytrium kinnereticum]
MRLLTSTKGWLRCGLRLLCLLKAVKAEEIVFALVDGEDIPTPTEGLVVNLNPRNDNSLKPEAGPAAAALVRNGGNGFRPAGEKEDGADESPGLEQYLTWTLPPGPSTTAIIPATDDGIVTETKTLDKRAYEATAGIYFQEMPDFPPHAPPAPTPMIRGFEHQGDDDTVQLTAELKHYLTKAPSPTVSPYIESVDIDRRDPPEDTIRDPVLLPPVVPLVRMVDNPNIAPAAAARVGSTSSATSATSQATASPEVNAAPAIIRMPGDSPIADSPVPPSPSVPSPAVIPPVDMSRGNQRRGIEDIGIGLTEESTVPLIRLPAGDIAPPFAISSNETLEGKSTASSLAKHPVARREDGSTPTDDDSASNIDNLPPMPTEPVDFDEIEKRESPDVVNVGSPPSPLLRDNGASPAMIVSRRSHSNDDDDDDVDDCVSSWQSTSVRKNLAFKASQAGSTFEILALSATMVTILSAFVLSVRQSLKADAKRSGNPKLARWSASNGIVILHMFTRSIQFSIVAMMSLGPDPLIDYLVSTFTSPSEKYFITAVAMVVFYALSHAILSSSMAPRIVTSSAGKIILRICSLAVSFIGSSAILPIFTVLFQTISCHYRDGGIPKRDPSSGICTVTCWTSEHWTLALASFAVVLLGIPLLISTANTWQTLDAQVDIKHRRWFNTTVVTATVVLSIANVWLRENPLVLSFSVAFVSFVLTSLTFFYSPTNVISASHLVGFTFLASGISGTVGLLANTFYAERALWIILLIVGWSSAAFAAVSFSSQLEGGLFDMSSKKHTSGRTFTFEVEKMGNNLRERIHLAATKFKITGEQTPIGSATVEKEISKSAESHAPSTRRAAFFNYVSGSAPAVFSRNRLEEMATLFFEEKIIEWTGTGIIDEPTAFCIADAIERSDAYLQLIFDRIIVCGISDTNDTRLLQAIKFAIASGLLLTKDVAIAQKIITDDMGEAVTEQQNSKKTGERKPLLLGREESHTQVIGGEDMI